MEDWQNRLHKMKERGRHLLETEMWSDCRFLVGSAPNQRIIAGHKLILAMASPVFERMFYGNLPDKTDPIVIPDVQPEAFFSLLEYIYTDNINISSFDKACELCYVANKYMLPYVVENCTQFLWSDLSPKNACRAYEFAKLFDEPRLMESSMKIIASKTMEVFNDPSFCDIEVSTLMAILDQDKLNINSELDLFNALVKYATERGMLAEEEGSMRDQHSQEQQPQCSQMEHMDAHLDSNAISGIVEVKTEPDVSAMLSDHADDETPFASPNIDDIVVVDSDSGAEADDHQPSTSHNASQHFVVDPQRIRSDKETLRSAVKKIRFLTMSPQQFAEGPARSKLLEQHEALAILIKISSPTINNCPMPEGFCYSRKSRSCYEPRSHYEMSSYRHSVPSNGTSPLAMLDLQQHSSCAGVAAPSSSQQPSAVGIESDMAATNDTRKTYCVRTVNQQFDYRNTSVTDCGVTFQVDTNIWITGVQVPTQVLCGELMNSAGFSDRYMEILYAHIQDMQGSRLTYTHCTSRVRYDSLLEISFDRPVYIYRNQRYKVFVVFNKVGWYPMYTCVPDVVCNRVKFSFNVGDPNESVRDGLIRAIVFSHPQERGMVE